MSPGLIAVAMSKCTYRALFRTIRKTLFAAKQGHESGASEFSRDPLTGIIIDRTGSFSWAFIVSAVCAVVAMLAWCVVIRRVATVQWPEALANRTFADAPAA